MLYNEQQVKELQQSAFEEGLRQGKMTSFTLGREYLTTNEVAELYRISIATLHRLKKSGVLHPIQIGRNLKWSVVELQKFN